MAKRALRSLIFIAVLALPGTAGHTEESDGAAATEATFQSEFAPFRELPDTPEPGPEVVDLETFDPPIEPEATGTDLGSGVASYYGKRFHGRRTASGERFDMHAMTAAHKTLPFGSRVRVTNPRTGKSVIVRINDRGPFTPGRTIDLSRAAAEEIGLVRRGHGTVELALLD
ncbi:septal ring lytic transglycosylase RlpA family protein [Qipengyuania vesicularis]|uniref:septal ring lytic transglycosylase RlpA family protein n=1 Tax=Qipengyuania vesicularis TaxID=2867232 RepID=UPI001C888501|nr:septal ring lytic transglycosylase RlpA family protein [Qipengyuania vesicularis]MBX7526632.1 septal ring lytic transglycosylase RlpA family protein [Qipengyuania vesicularis]